MAKKLNWVGGALGTISGALSMVKLATHFLEVGLGGVPAYVVDAYADFIDDVRRWLIEVPFGFTPPEWVMHGLVVWSLFFGSNLRFLTYDNHGVSLYSGVGSVGRGTRRALAGWRLRALNLIVAATGPLFTAFVFTLWLANRRMGPTGQGHWGDRFMISNRTYTLRISKLYLLILLLAPVLAAILIAWGAADDLG